MGFSFTKKESAADGIRRMALERIDSAVAALRAEDDAVAEGVHDARKRCKQIRAILRLVRGALGDDYAAENIRYRDYARQLSAARDAQVLLETLARLGGDLDLIAPVRRALTTRRDRLAETALTTERRARLAAELEADRSRVAAWPLRGEGFEVLGDGLLRGYKRARRAMKRAYRSGDDGDFHEWRKQVKYHWYHIRMLAPSWPAVLEARAAELKRLADWLGEDHDLAVLRATLAADPDGFGSDTAIEPLLARAARRQRRLRADARRLGRKLYAERGDDFLRRMSAYWEAWRG